MKKATIFVFAVISIFIAVNIHAETALILDKATIWRNGTSFDADIDGNIINVYGIAGRQSAGIVLEDQIPINQAKKIVIDVNNALNSSNKFAGSRMFKLEIDRKSLKTESLADRNNLDTTYVNSRDGRFEFPLKQSTMSHGYISKLQIVFYDCDINKLLMKIWLQ